MFGKRRKIAGTIALILAVLVISMTFMCGCSKDESQIDHKKYVMAMNTNMELTAYGPAGEDAVEAAAKMIYALDAKISVINGKSQVSQLNARTSSVLSGDALELFRLSERMSGLTDGSFDITVLPLVEAWGFIRGSHHVLTGNELDELMPAIGMDHLSAEYTKDEQGQDQAVITFDNEKSGIDFGAIAKGYTSDRVREIFKEKGVTSGLIALGGNICVLGSKPDGSDWKISVTNPQKPESTICSVKVSDTSLVTSGTYMRFFEKNGVRYHHIIDPATGKPADNELASVTIITNSGAEADALSTALFVKGLDGAEQFWRSCTDIDFDAIFITNDNEIYITEGIEDRFSGHKAEVIRR